MPILGLVRTHLQALQEIDGICVPGPSLAQRTLAINARLVPSAANVRKLQKLRDEAIPCVYRGNGSLMAAVLPSGITVPPNPFDAGGFAQFEQAIGQARLPADEARLSALDYPHDLIREHVATFHDNLVDWPGRGQLREVAEGVLVGAGCDIDNSTRFDTSKGPIIVEDAVRIGPFCYLRGPVHLAAECQIAEHTSIKDNVSIGHGCRIGGEVQESTIEEFSNKRHYGFLGHSYVGRWVNLGAGTTNSNLKNTYGKIRIHSGGHRIPTGMQFLGCMIGDYSRSAINTSIFTGMTIGVCSMLYGFITTNVPSFANYAKSFGQVTELPASVMVEIQRRMFERRGKLQQPADVKLLHDLYSIVRSQRQLAEGPLSL
jgi:glucose-1-phosphate thymidylyltransferase